MITGDNPTNDDGDDTDRDYYHADGASDTSGLPSYIPYDNSPANVSIANLDYENFAIILNPSGVNRHSLIAGMETNHDNLHNNEEPP